MLDTYEYSKTSDTDSYACNNNNNNNNNNNQ
jgi:hypothetical protein